MTSKLPPIHPGELLAEDLSDVGVTQAQLARAIGVPRSRINAIVKGHRPITIDTALRLARFFGTSNHYWLSLQMNWDIEIWSDLFADKLERVVPLDS
jgi:addiction module HigA family antidote